MYHLHNAMKDEYLAKAWALTIFARDKLDLIYVALSSSVYLAEAGNWGNQSQ